jgi:chromosomal replication initiation ATPase DnaA
MLEKIENIICLGEDLSAEEIHARNREGKIKETRQIIMYFARKLSGGKMSHAAIASFFGQDHATSLHACKTIQNLIDTDKVFEQHMAWHETRLKILTIDQSVNLAKNTLAVLEYDLMNFEKKVADLKKTIIEIKYVLEVDRMTNKKEVVNQTTS